jgi:asparagine synthase (glutamine-hydrolysing)
MCGIAGVISERADAPGESIVRQMLATMRHRGPDDEGTGCRGAAVLGARRLAIIDVAGGHQPMCNEDGTILAVQNGEIYNFAELRNELLERGHQFHTRNDTEILPHAYEEWGQGLVARLRGMFAFAVWDDKERLLLLARDRFGKKPLFYSQFDGGFAFGSEIQALLAHPDVPREIDAEAINEYLSFGYVGAPRTAFASIRKVPPAHVLGFQRGQSSVTRYWNLSFTPKLRLSATEAAHELRRRVDESVRLRLISDVPLGAFLSGGLDSSTVVAYMARHSSQPVKTFSIGFRDSAFDELAHARVVATAFSTDHHEFIVDAEHADALPKLARHLGEPFADSSIVPTYQVAELTRKYVTVALNGDGGDEMFGGYDRYRAAIVADAMTSWLPKPLISRAAASAEALPLGTGTPRSVQRIRRFAVSLGLASHERYLSWGGFFTGTLRDLVLGERLRGVAGSDAQAYLDHAKLEYRATSPAEQYMAADYQAYLPGDLLVKVDIASMACSLEARSPLLDHELVEFVAMLPVDLKVSPFKSKILLRRAMRGILPEQILQRQKMGFAAPVGSWLRGPLRAMVEDLSLASKAADAGLVNTVGMRTLVEDHMSGRADRTFLLWNLLMLELWMREVFHAPRT